MLTRIIGKQIGKRLAKKAIRTAAQKRALRKAVLASAKARAKKVGGMALAGPKAYARSVVKRGAKKKAKTLEKIKTSYLKNRESINTLTKQLPDAQRNRDILKGNIGKIRSIIEETEAKEALTQNKFFVLGRKAKLKALSDSKSISKSHLANAIKAHRKSSSNADQIIGTRATALNEADRLASLYGKTLKSKKIFEAKTVVGDVGKITIIGGAGYGAYSYNKQRNKKS